MSDFKNRIDNLAKDKLYNYEIDPPSSSWKNIEFRLNTNKPKFSWSVISAFAAGIALLLSLGLGYYLGSKESVKFKEQLKNHSITQTIQVNSILVDSTQKFVSKTNDNSIIGTINNKEKNNYVAENKIVKEKIGVFTSPYP